MMEHGIVNGISTIKVVGDNMKKKPINIHKNLYGFSWQFPGGAESSYSYLVRKIQNDTRLSQKKKDELIEDVTYLVGHVLNDADTQIRHDYGSACSSGIKYLKFDLFDRPKRWMEKLFYEQFLSIYATASLQSLDRLNNIRKRVEKTAERLLIKKETDK